MSSSKPEIGHTHIYKLPNLSAVIQNMIFIEAAAVLKLIPIFEQDVIPT